MNRASESHELFSYDINHPWSFASVHVFYVYISPTYRYNYSFRINVLFKIDGLFKVKVQNNLACLTGEKFVSTFFKARIVTVRQLGWYMRKNILFRSHVHTMNETKMLLNLNCPIENLWRDEIASSIGPLKLTASLHHCVTKYCIKNNNCSISIPNATKNHTIIHKRYRKLII